MTSLVLALLLLAPAEPLVIDTSNLADGQSITAEVEGAKVTVVRRGERRHVLIERGEDKDEITIEKEGDRLRVGSVVRSEGFLVKPQRIIIDGVPIEPFFDNLLVPAPGRGTPRTWFCPRDETLVRVPHDRQTEALRCPVDGAVMLPRGAPRRQFHLLED